jgi:protein-S-isoprenylcysteine O-methyltransferase Ste14
VLTAAAAGAMVALDRWAPMARMWTETLGGVVPAAIGLGLVVWAAVTLARAGTTLHPHDQPSVLVRHGPFAFSRNPIYLGFSLMLVGLAAGLGSSAPWAIWAAWLFAMNHLFIAREEATLAATFGDTFASYAQRVRRWL